MLLATGNSHKLRWARPSTINENLTAPAHAAYATAPARGVVYRVPVRWGLGYRMKLTGSSVIQATRRFRVRISSGLRVPSRCGPTVDGRVVHCRTSRLRSPDLAYAGIFAEASSQFPATPALDRAPVRRFPAVSSYYLPNPRHSGRPNTPYAGPPTVMQSDNSRRLQQFPPAGNADLITSHRHIDVGRITSYGCC